MVQSEKQLASTVRGRIDIIASILCEARNGAKKTRIMYSCNLSFKQLRAYLDFLLRKGMVSLDASVENGNSRVFRVTEKGLAYLAAYDNLQAVISS